MRFLSVAERELRAAARQKATHRTRWITAAVFFALLVWLLWLADAFRYRRAAPEVFNAFSVLIFFYIIIIGTARTADCLSSEKREGTLGLLFLTNLNSAEIIAGKLCSHALAAVYSLIAIFPMLALPLLIGGITGEHFWRTVLALVNTIFFSVAAGFVASVLCVRQFTAMALGAGLALTVGAGLAGAAAIVNSVRGPRYLVDGLSAFCPLYSLMSAADGRIFGRNHYWLSLAAVACLSCAWIGLVIWRLARTWRDRPKSVPAFSRIKFWQRWRQRGGMGRLALRQRLLEINPFLWLDGRRRISAPIFMALTVLLVVITAYVTAPYFTRALPAAGAIKPLAGSLFAWLWTGLAIHALVLYYAAMVASQRLAEDKQTGALELILSTPTTERSISRGLWLAFGRRMFFPATVAVLVHFFFIWQGATLLVLEPPTSLPPGTTAGQVLWHVFLDQPIGGVRIEWGFRFGLQILLLALVMFAIVWLTLGWVGRWLGLRIKHPGFAPMISLALVFVPPVILFSLVCYLADEWNFVRMPERQFMPLMMWVAFGIGVGHCLLLSGWAATRLRRDLRTVAMSRYQPPADWRWRLPRRRTVLRLAAATTALAVALVLIVLGFYGYQNWRSQRTWTVFQKELKRKGESLDLSALLSGPVSDNENFVRTPAFQNLLNKKNSETARLLDRMKQFDLPDNGFNNSRATMEWIVQDLSPLDTCVAWTAPKSGRVTSTNRADHAAAILRGLQPHSEVLREVAAAARLPYFQTSTNRTALAVLHPTPFGLPLLARLHLLFQVRACALLATDRNDEAGEDVLTGFRLAHLARQEPDARSSLRTQIMLTRSLQPLWEGLGRHHWSETQLTAFQKELAGFNLLADHTNAVRRFILANIEAWSAIPDGADPHASVPSYGSGYRRESQWDLQPRAWWFDTCIQLHQAGQTAIDKVDVPGARVHLIMDWSNFEGLPVEGQSLQLLQQGSWLGANPVLVAFAQNAVNQAIIACALERSRLANGKYPATLEQLVPAYLDRIPNDIVRGRPMIYQQNDDGSYVLLGVGANERDNRKDPGSDDWLWSYPTNAPAVTPLPQ